MKINRLLLILGELLSNFQGNFFGRKNQLDSLCLPITEKTLCKSSSLTRKKTTMVLLSKDLMLLHHLEIKLTKMIWKTLIYSSKTRKTKVLQFNFHHHLAVKNRMIISKMVHLDLKFKTMHNLNKSVNQMELSLTIQIKISQLILRVNLDGLQTQKKKLTSSKWLR